MKTLLHKTTTLQSISNPTPKLRARWTPKLADARVFAAGLEAVDHCYWHEIMNRRMLVAFDDVRQNFTVAVTDASTAQDAATRPRPKAFLSAVLHRAIEERQSTERYVRLAP